MKMRAISEFLVAVLNQEHTVGATSRSRVKLAPKDILRGKKLVGSAHPTTTLVIVNNQFSLRAESEVFL